MKAPQLVFCMLHSFVKVKSYCKVDIIKKKEKRKKNPKGFKSKLLFESTQQNTPKLSQVKAF